MENGIKIVQHLVYSINFQVDFNDLYILQNRNSSSITFYQKDDLEHRRLLKLFVSFYFKIVFCKELECFL